LHQNALVQISGANQDFTELSFVFHQSVARRIGMLGLEPHQRFVANPRAQIAGDSPQRRNSINPVGAERPQRNAKCEDDAIEPPCTNHSNAALNDLHD
jgi:hypothetical protein